jgi:hypothetical protein
VYNQGKSIACQKYNLRIWKLLVLNADFTWLTAYISKSYNGRNVSTYICMYTVYQFIIEKRSSDINKYIKIIFFLILIANTQHIIYQ